MSLTFEQTTSLLRLGLSDPPRPVDELIERLRAADGASWLATTLERGPLAGVGNATDVLVEGRCTPEQLRTVKDEARAMSKKSDARDRLAGIAAYFLAIAAGLRHHGTLLTSRDRAAVNEVLLDLAEAAPDPFSGLLMDATLVTDSAGD